MKSLLARSTVRTIFFSGLLASTLVGCIGGTFPMSGGTTQRVVSVIPPSPSSVDCPRLIPLMCVVGYDYNIESYVLSHPMTKLSPPIQAPVAQK